MGTGIVFIPLWSSQKGQIDRCLELMEESIAAVESAGY